MKRALAVAIAIVLAPACEEKLPPLPQVVIVADVNVPVPLAATRLRIDLLDEAGTWFASTDVARPDERDWPVSFGVFSDDESRPRRVWVRLRAYLDGRTRDYRGPRLIEAGRDVTPPLEPDPLYAIDRLVRVALSPGKKTRARVLLHGACISTPARLPPEAASCVDVEKQRAPVEDAATSEDDAPIGASAQGTWLAEPACTPAEGERVCIPGGATLLGTGDGTLGVVRASAPVRLFGVRRFFIDRNEYSVGRHRAALARGFAPLSPAPIDNPGTLDGGGRESSCTWSSSPQGREDHGLNCLTWSYARALCREGGGDLPAEVQWEHAATVAGKRTKSRFAWGNEQPTCERMVYGGMQLGPQKPRCDRPGPAAPSASANDVTPQGVLALGGNLHEWVLDDAQDYDGPCWSEATIVDPRCGDPDAPSLRKILRGASWASEATTGAARIDQDPRNGFSPVGFRCVYTEAR